MNQTAREEIESLRKEYELCYGKKANKYWTRKKLSKCVFSFYVLANVYKKKIAKIQALVRGYIVRKNKPKSMNQLPMDIVKTILLYRRHPVAQIFVNAGGIKAFYNKCYINYRHGGKYRAGWFPLYNFNLWEKTDIVKLMEKNGNIEYYYTCTWRGYTVNPRNLGGVYMDKEDKDEHYRWLKHLHYLCFNEKPKPKCRRRTIIRELMKV